MAAQYLGCFVAAATVFGVYKGEEVGGGVGPGQGELVSYGSPHIERGQVDFAHIAFCCINPIRNVYFASHAIEVIFASHLFFQNFDF